MQGARVRRRARGGEQRRARAAVEPRGAALRPPCAARRLTSSLCRSRAALARVVVLYDGAAWKCETCGRSVSDHLQDTRPPPVGAGRPPDGCSGERPGVSQRRFKDAVISGVDIKCLTGKYNREQRKQSE